MTLDPSWLSTASRSEVPVRSPAPLPTRPVRTTAVIGIAALVVLSVLPVPALAAPTPAYQPRPVQPVAAVPVTAVVPQPAPDRPERRRAQQHPAPAWPSTGTPVARALRSGFQWRRGWRRSTGWCGGWIQQENGNFSHRLGSLQVIVNDFGGVVTIIT